MPNFYFNPQPGNTVAAFVLSEANWRQQISRWVSAVDQLEAQLVAQVGVQWLRAPDGDYWVDVNAAAPPAFTPPGTNAGNANMLTTDTTLWSADFPVGA